MKNKVMTPELKLEQCKHALDVDPEYFTAWEQQFIADRYEFQGIGSNHTDAQIKQINRIYEKAMKR